MNLLALMLRKKSGFFVVVFFRAGKLDRSILFERLSDVVMKLRSDFYC